MTPTTRKSIYTALVGLVPLLVGLGWISKDDGGVLTDNLDNVLIVVGVVLSSGGQLLARLHTPTKGKHEQGAEHIEVIPASEATSDTKSDAAHL